MSYKRNGKYESTYSPTHRPSKNDSQRHPMKTQKFKRSTRNIAEAGAIYEFAQNIAKHRGIGLNALRAEGGEEMLCIRSGGSTLTFFYEDGYKMFASGSFQTHEDFTIEASLGCATSISYEVRQSLKSGVEEVWVNGRFILAYHTPESLAMHEEQELMKATKASTQIDNKGRL